MGHGFYSRWVLFVLVSVWLACGQEDKDTESLMLPDAGSIHPTLGEIMDIIAESTAPDSDGDHLPDDVEVLLGTDPQDRDSDHDGTPDLVEIFGLGSFDEDSHLTDQDGDGLIAPADQDDNNDGLNDGDQTDSDGDGISNLLEFYGYTYDWLSGGFRLWDGVDTSARYFKTDPYQVSSDQDPFDDWSEVTGVNMDVSVREPGNLPMVAAYPDIIVRLEGSAVTLDQTITWSYGESLSQGTTWERTMETTHSHSSEQNWEIGTEAEVGFDLSSLGVTANVSVHANYGGSSTMMNQSSFSTASGGSVLSEENWTKATTTNPTDAAHIKLFLKVFNHGTAVASNVVPTITLRIGGHNIATFEPGNSQINVLEPESAYPAAPGVFWVVDSIDTGTGVIPISLTLGELKALESGAPVSITVTQIAADVMTKDPESGAYQTMGDWNEYIARFKMISASLFLDIGDGNFVRSFVYADDSLTSPVVTLGDALRWVTNGYCDSSTGEPMIEYLEEKSGTKKETSLGNWKIAVDGDTYKHNGFDDLTAPDADFNLASLELRPGSLIVAKAPRHEVPDAGMAPQIHYAFLDVVTGGVTAVVSDYNGIEKVEFIDSEEQARQMAEDIPGSCFNVYFPYQDLDAYPSGYTFDGSEKVRVTGTNGLSNEKRFIEIFEPELPDPPTILAVAVDTDNDVLEVRVRSEMPLDNPPAFLRAYHYGFSAVTSSGVDYLELERVTNSFEDQEGWAVPWPSAWTVVEGIRIVAYVMGDIWSDYVTNQDDAQLNVSASLEGLIVTYGIGNIIPAVCDPIIPLICFSLPTSVAFWGVDLDTNTWTSYWLPADPPGEWEPGDPAIDAWIRMMIRVDMPYYLPSVHFRDESILMGLEPLDNSTYFGQVTLASVLAANPQLGQGPHDFVNSPSLLGYRTNEGRFGKLRVVATAGGEYEGNQSYLYDFDFLTFQ